MTVYCFDLQILFERHLALVKPAEFVDLVLILTAYFDFILTNRCFVFFRKLQ